MGLVKGGNKMKKRKKDNRLFVSLIILVSIVMVFGGMLLIKPDILQKFTGEQDSEVFKADDVTTTYSGDKSGVELSSSEPITYTPTPETEVASAENSEQLPAKTTEEIPLTQPIETQPKIQSGYFENLKTINYAFNSGTTQNKIICKLYVSKKLFFKIKITTYAILSKARPWIGHCILIHTYDKFFFKMRVW